MAGFGGQNNDDEITGINITPLVDVVLVLLVIFLMTAPVIYQSAIKVQLPSAKSGESDTDPKKPLGFTITKDGLIYWGSDKMSFEELSKKLASVAAGYPDKTLSSESATITADEGTPHGTVIKLMDALRQQGLIKFGMMVNSK